MKSQILIDHFYRQFPLGIEDPSFKEISKKHRSNQRIMDMFKAIDIKQFKSKQSEDIEMNIKRITKMVSQSTVISTFEKMAFKNYIADENIQYPFLKSLYEFLNNTNENTFDLFVQTLSLKKNEKNANPAKWPIVTFFLLYYQPYKEIFIKPTTIKRFAMYMNVDIEYTALPNYNTYQNAKQLVLDFKNEALPNTTMDNMMVQAIIFTSI